MQRYGNAQGHTAFDAALRGRLDAGEKCLQATDVVGDLPPWHRPLAQCQPTLTHAPDYQMTLRRRTRCPHSDTTDHADRVRAARASRPDDRGSDDARQCRDKPSVVSSTGQSPLTSSRADDLLLEGVAVATERIWSSSSPWRPVADPQLRRSAGGYAAACCSAVVFS
jgi:hypothetical protein